MFIGMSGSCDKNESARWHSDLRPLNTGFDRGFKIHAAANFKNLAQFQKTDIGRFRWIGRLIRMLRQKEKAGGFDERRQQIPAGFDIHGTHLSGLIIMLPV